ncbi:hypothetical protein [Bradyrhizobium sp. SRS-191]|uniref:hypothetical protein n=1 Tax=Bradyrhizobium sp. SRS-191 TaxID=2962606 RepID=UPI00211EB1E3|nr:hypothetical protein [Bradyrhizobium sp. SRS-191]
MTRKLSADRTPSNQSTREDAGRKSDGAAWFAPIARKLEEIFTRKVAGETAFRACVDISTAERWLAGTSAPQGVHLARLLCSDIGDQLHVALIENVQTPWAEARRAELKRAQLLREREEIERRLAALGPLGK